MVTLDINEASETHADRALIEKAEKCLDQIGLACIMGRQEEAVPALQAINAEAPKVINDLLADRVRKWKRDVRRSRNRLLFYLGGLIVLALLASPAGTSVACRWAACLLGFALMIDWMVTAAIIGLR